MPLLPFLQPVHHRQHTVLAIAPYIGKGGAYSRVVPHIAHQRLVAVSPPPRGLSPARVQQLYDELEQDRAGSYGSGLNYIIVNVAPTPPPRRRPLPLSKISYIEDVTDHNNIQTLARETRLMRRDADNLMIRINEGLPPPVFSLRSIPLRSSGDLREAIDIRRRYVHERNNPHIPYSQVRNNIYRMSMYEEPDKVQLRGSGNLACLSYAGGRPIPKRRRFYPEDKIRDDVNFRSYYFKLRDAANYGREYIKQIYQPLYRSKKTILGLPDEPNKDRKEYESKWVTRALAKPDGPTAPSRRAAAAAAAAAAEAPKVRASTAPRQEVDVTLPGPRKSVIEHPEIKPKVENVPEEKVVVKIPKKEEEPPVPVEAKAEETIKVPPTPPQPEPPVKEPEPEPAPEPTPAPEPEPTPAPAEPEKPVEVAPPPPEPVEEPKQEIAEPAVEAAAPPPEPAPEPAPAEAPAKEEPVVAEPTPAPEAPPPAEPEPEPKVEETPPAVEQPPAEPVKEAEAVAESSAPAEAAPAEAPAQEAEAAAGAAEEDTGDKGEQDIQIEEIEDAVIEDDVGVQINEEVTMDEVCDIQIEENDLEIADPNQVQPELETTQPPQNDLDSNEQPEPEPTECQLESEQVPSNTEDQNIAAEVSIVVADIDGPIEKQPQDVDQSSLRTVEEIQADAERRRTEFARLLEEHAEIVGTVQRLESEGGAQEAAAAIEN